MPDVTRTPWPADTRHLRVGDVRVDLRYRRVSHPEGETELPQRMFELLLVFLAEPQVLHTRAALFQRVWPGVIVEDANLSQSVWMLRKALGETRKHWIRTVAKSGYVFEPPTPVTADAPAAPRPSAPPAPVPAPAPEPAGPEPAAAAGIAAPPAAHRTRPPRRWRWAGAAAFALLAAGLAAWWYPGRERPSAAAAPTLTLTLVTAEDAAAPHEVRWPLRLLHAWLEWKLGSLPEVNLVPESSLATNAGATPPQVVLLAASVVPGQPRRVSLLARFEAGGHEHRLSREGDATQMPALVDSLSREVLVQLLPARAEEPWPALEIGADAGRRYADARDALKRRDWAESAEILREVVGRAPRFGLARMELARSYSRLALAAPAVEQMEAALELLAPVPKDVAQALHAYRLAVDPRREAAAVAAYAELARRHPGKSAWTLDHARLLARTGQLQQALAILSQPRWQSEPVGQQIARLLTLGEVHLGLGDSVSARRDARAADQLAREAGPGWVLERASASLLLAQADAFEHEGFGDLSGFERAARQFEAAGDHTDALYARFLAETLRPGKGPNPRLDALLVQAREGGYHWLEVQILRMEAFRHYREGDMAQYRARLEQALATARASGDTQSQQYLEFDLLNEDLLRANFASAERRIARLRAADPHGENALWIDQFVSALAGIRGRYAQAESTLDRHLRNDGDGRPRLTAATERLACVKGELRLVRGDLTGARRYAALCAESAQPSTRLQALLTRAGVELMAGDRQRAGRLLDAAETETAQLPDGPDRWAYAMQLATLLTRIGALDRAQALYAAARTPVRHAGYAWLTANIETGLAEVAAARGDWPASRTHLAAARHGLPRDAWLLTNRLDVVEAAMAHATGEQARATTRLAAVHAQAHRLGDVISQLETHSLAARGVDVPGCGEAERTALEARTGLRGATLAWLTGASGADSAELRLAAAPAESAARK
ncbi:winged helix-turn-helix domain-containing protein [Vulcaniibacterium gelatinicum]|uniref:winged helix-turn-helix domain-containing protein n=1 Tax=Vulcaniibacterium gelatinicum TaxID=2598725 RepID=UPI0011CA7D51|nr:winged helix-turn-helix domain-containing protein [Vulcaniibacterium gelatinicum]